MLSERVRERLEQLNRQPLPADGDGAQRGGLPAAPIARGLPGTEGLNPAAPGGASSELMPRTEAGLRHALVTPQADCEGEEIETVWGTHWRWRQPIEQVWPASVRYLTSMTEVPLRDPEFEEAQTAYERDLALLRQCFPRQSVYLDLETCGFAGSMVFLIGLVHWDEQHLVLTQLWARSYAEEKAILQSLWSLLDGCRLLVTFNGKSFDWPHVHDRSTMHHLGFRRSTPGSPIGDLSVEQSIHEPAAKGGALSLRDPRPEPAHLDLLHHARRRWRHQLPNCRLQTLERYVCGRHRAGDLPSSEIPQAYHVYVRTGRSDVIPTILHHNALDLVTLLQLALVLIRDPVT